MSTSNQKSPEYLRKTPVQHERFLCLVSGYLFSRPRLPQCGKVVQRRLRSSNSLPYWISCSLHRPPDALTVDPITSPWLFDLARKIPTHQRPKKNTMRCMVFFFGIRRLPIFPGRHQPSIFGTTELNFCVRYGNRWTLSVINTNLLTFVSLLRTVLIILRAAPNVNTFFKKI